MKPSLPKKISGRILSGGRGENTIGKQAPDSHAVAASVNKACASKPLDLYGSAEEMGDDVKRHLLGYSSMSEKTACFVSYGSSAAAIACPA